MISLEMVRVMREAVAVIHSKDMHQIVQDGAAREFNKIIVPELRKLLEAKGAPSEFQDSLIDLLEKVYAAQHVAAYAGQEPEFSSGE